MHLGRVHLVVGVVGMLAFAGTGQWLAHHSPPLREYAPFLRALYRSRHLYLMFGAGLNTLLGLYWQERVGWRRQAQRLGSALVLAAPAFALVGFVRDPVAGTLAGALFGRLAAFAAFGGTVLHVLSALRLPAARR